MTPANEMFVQDFLRTANAYRDRAPLPGLPKPARDILWLKPAADVPSSAGMFAEESGNWRLAYLLVIAAEAAKVSVSDMSSARRDREATRGRQLFCWLARRFTKRSLPDIGRFIDRDHTTVLHALRVIDRVIVRDGSASDPADPRTWASFLLSRDWPTGPVKPSLIRQSEAA